jgi:Cu(I)/Ag(I) efflux system periplasmic protein CusF
MKIVLAILVSAVFAVAALTSVNSIAQGQPRDITNGEIRKVDKDAGKVTIKHGEILNLGMPAMTMVYQVKEKTMLDKVQAGDKIKFKVISENGTLVVTEIQLGK